MPIRTLSERSMREVGGMLRWYRNQARAREGDTFSPTLAGPYFTRLVRLQGEDPGDPNDASYPAQVDGSAAILPGVMLDLDLDTGDAILSDDEYSYSIYSPYGWIPRLTEVGVSLIGGELTVLPGTVPILEVTTGVIAAGASGTVTMTKSGAADGQNFTAWLNHMNGTNSAASGDEAWVRLMEKQKLWRIGNKEC